MTKPKTQLTEQQLHTELLNIVEGAAHSILSGRLNTQTKQDGSDVTDHDLRITEWAHQVLDSSGIMLVIEEDDPRKTRNRTLIALDPVDGTSALARSQKTWTVGATHYEDGTPGYTVAAGWGIVPCYRSKGEFEGFTHARNNGFILQAGPEKTMLIPLDYIKRDPAPSHLYLPLLQPRPALDDAATLLIDPCMTLPAGFRNGIRVQTFESSIAAQVQVALGQADACIIGPNHSRMKNDTQPGPKLWDLVPRIVANAGLVYVQESGLGRGNVVEPQDLLDLCNTKYELMERLVICHPDHLWQAMNHIQHLRELLK